MTAFSATLCSKLADEASLDLKSCNIFDHQLRMNGDLSLSHLEVFAVLVTGLVIVLVMYIVILLCKSI